MRIIAFFLTLFFPVPVVAQQTNAVPVVGHPASPFKGQKVTITMSDGTTRVGTISGVDGEGVSLVTDSGGGKALFAEMSEADKTKFGFNPAALAAYKDQMAAQRIADIERGKKNRKMEIDEANREAHEEAARLADTQKYASQFILTGRILQYVRGDNPGTLVQQTDKDREIIFIKDDFLDGHVGDLMWIQVASYGSYNYVNLVGEDVHARQCLIVPDAFKKQLYEPAPTRVVFPAPDN